MLTVRRLCFMATLQISTETDFEKSSEGKAIKKLFFMCKLYVLQRQKKYYKYHNSGTHGNVHVSPIFFVLHFGLCHLGTFVALFLGFLPNSLLPSFYIAY